MEGEPLRQAVDTGGCLPPSTKIHHIRGREVNADSCIADSTAPHVQPQCLGRIQLHLARKWSRETKATTRRPTQPDEELARVVPNMVRHGTRSRWQRRGRRAALSTSSPSASASPSTSPAASPPPSSPCGWLCHHGYGGRRDALSSGDP